MATNEEALPSRPGAIQVKTPKGTRDWFGQDAKLRKHVLYVRPAMHWRLPT